VSLVIRGNPGASMEDRGAFDWHTHRNFLAAGFLWTACLGPQKANWIMASIVRTAISFRNLRITSLKIGHPSVHRMKFTPAKEGDTMRLSTLVSASANSCLVVEEVPRNGNPSAVIATLAKLCLIGPVLVQTPDNTQAGGEYSRSCSMFSIACSQACSVQRFPPNDQAQLDPARPAPAAHPMALVATCPAAVSEPSAFERYRKHVALQCPLLRLPAPAPEAQLVAYVLHELAADSGGVPIAWPSASLCHATPPMVEALERFWRQQVHRARQLERLLSSPVPRTAACAAAVLRCLYVIRGRQRRVLVEQLRRHSGTLTLIALHASMQNAPFTETAQLPAAQLLRMLLLPPAELLDALGGDDGYGIALRPPQLALFEAAAAPYAFVASGPLTFADIWRSWRSCCTGNHGLMAFCLLAERSWHRLPSRCAARRQLSWDTHMRVWHWRRLAQG
jgi:hypothetical protein